MKHLITLIPILLFAAVGAYIVFGASARPGDPPKPPFVANPGLAQTCGLDIAILIDASSSMGDGGFTKAKNAAKSFATALQNKENWIAVSKVKAAPSTDGRESPFGQNTTAIHQAIDAMDMGDSSEMADLTWVTSLDPRPNRPNLVMMISDFQTTSTESNVSKVKQSGTRILAIVHPTAGGTFEEVKPEAAYVAGPNMTASVLTSDILLITNLDTLTAALINFAQQMCNPPPPPCPDCDGGGNGDGNGGGGTGNNGNGNGQHPGNGTGGGSSGAMATSQSDDPNSLPSATGQGNNAEQPKLEPSPFFDGRTYAPGSDPIDKALGNLSIGGKRILHGWLYLLMLFVVIGNLIAGYFLWWRRMPLDERSRWTSKLHIG